jgi:hypothetical protein
VASLWQSASSGPWTPGSAETLWAGLLSWFLLVSYMLLVAAEVNVVLRWRPWPRSLTGEFEPADRLAMRRLAEAARRDRRERIAVSFGDGGDDPRSGPR